MRSKRSDYLLGSMPLTSRIPLILQLSERIRPFCNGERRITTLLAGILKSL